MNCMKGWFYVFERKDVVYKKLKKLNPTRIERMTLWIRSS